MIDFINELSNPSKINLLIASVGFIMFFIIYLIKEKGDKEYSLTNFVSQFMYIYFIITIVINFLLGFIPMDMFYIKNTILIVVFFLICFLGMNIFKFRSFYFIMKKLKLKSILKNIVPLKNRDIMFNITKKNDLVCYLYIRTELTNENKSLIYEEIIEKNNLVDKVEFIEIY